MSNAGLMADLSNNNSHVDIFAYAGSGHIAIALKATEGEHFVDPDHHGWFVTASAHGLAVFHYHFARPDLGTDPHGEAAFFLKNVNPNWRDYLVLDLERGGPGNQGIDPSWSRAFDEYIQAHSRFATILYATRSTLQASDQWLVNRKKRLWDADWSSGPDARVPGYSVVLRQFTDGVFGPEPHTMPGIGRSDASVIRHSLLMPLLRNRGRRHG